MSILNHLDSGGELLTELYTIRVRPVPTRPGNGLSWMNKFATDLTRFETGKFCYGHDKSPSEWNFVIIFLFGLVFELHDAAASSSNVSTVNHTGNKWERLVFGTNRFGVKVSPINFCT